MERKKMGDEKERSSEAPSPNRQRQWEIKSETWKRKIRGTREIRYSVETLEGSWGFFLERW